MMKNIIFIFIFLPSLLYAAEYNKLVERYNSLIINKNQKDLYINLSNDFDNYYSNHLLEPNTYDNAYNALVYAGLLHKKIYELFKDRLSFDEAENYFTIAALNVNSSTAAANGYLELIRLYKEDNQGVMALLYLQDLEVLYPESNQFKEAEKLLINGKKKFVEEYKSKHKIKVIVLDPGHGGYDPGASYYGINEKDINLNIAKALKVKLEKQKFKVYLTREDDIFVHLKDRVKFANKIKADLFISIHTNAALNNSASGFEVYVYDSAATDKRALNLAKTENGKIDIDEIKNLKSILDKDSILIASHIQNYASKELNLSMKNNRGVKSAPFRVLFNTKMPSVLVEIGFLSNKDEAKKLLTRNYQNKIVNSMFYGITNF